MGRSGTAGSVGKAGRAGGVRAGGGRAGGVDDAGRRGWLLPALAAGWYAVILLIAHTSITDSDSPERALLLAATVLPLVISAGLAAAAAVGLGAVDLAGRRVSGLAGRAPLRLAVAGGGGLAVGTAGGGLMLAGYGTSATFARLAGTVAVAGLLAGLIGAVRPARLVGAALAGTLAWFLIGFVKGLWAGQLRQLFGASDTVLSQLRAGGQLSLTVALVGGVSAGLVAYRYLRRRDPAPRWPAYLATGAGPGLLLLVAVAVTQLGGAPLLNAAHAVNPVYDYEFDRQFADRIDTALVVLFVGAITAMVALGRTLGRPARE